VLVLLLLCLHCIQHCMRIAAERTSTSSKGILKSTHEKYMCTLQERRCMHVISKHLCDNYIRGTPHWLMRNCGFNAVNELGKVNT
jgi:hypothetical protein